MTSQEFIDKINAHRRQAKQLIEGNGGYNIKRGMAHTISGYVEDLFALFIAKKINRPDLKYLVDKVTSIRFADTDKAESFKPDVSIINDSALTHYFDLKTNMGWNRYFDKYLKKKNDFIQDLRGKKAWIRYGKNDVEHIIIDQNLIYQMVIIYGWNINPELLANNLLLAKEYPNVKVHVLYGENGNGGFQLNENAFEELYTTLN